MLRALSLYLSSDFCIYHQFLNSPQWGIDMNRADLHALIQMPAPLIRLSPSDLSEWAELQRKLALASQHRFDSRGFGEHAAEDSSQLLTELNDRVFNLLGLRKTERWLVEDFVHLQLQLTKGKATRSVLRLPTDEEKQAYLMALRDCLDSFLSERLMRHRIEVLADHHSALFSVSLVQSKVAIDPAIHKSDEHASRELRTIRDRLRSKHSQWVYFDRALKVYERKLGVLYQFKPLQRLHWTRRQAVLDADDIIAETLVEGGVS